MASKDFSTADGVGCVFAVLWFPVLMVVGFLLKGWALTYLWLWFVVPFFGLPPLGVAQAMGLAIVVGYLTKDHSTSDCQKKEGADGIWHIIVKATVEAVLPPLFAYLAGAIVKEWL